MHYVEGEVVREAVVTHDDVDVVSILVRIHWVVVEIAHTWYARGLDVRARSTKKTVLLVSSSLVKCERYLALLV